MVRLILAIIIVCIVCVPSAFARSFVVPLQANGTMHHIDKDSIQLAGQSSTMRMIKATMAVKSPKYEDIAHITYFYKYDLINKTIQKKPIILYMGTKLPYTYNSSYLDVNVVGSVDYIYANYAYYKEFGSYFSQDMINRYGSTDLSTNK